MNIAFAFLLAVELALLSTSCGSDNNMTCSAPLGMEDSRISSDNIQSWSPLLGKYFPAEARLNGVFAWCTAESLDSQKGPPYLQITLEEAMKITGIATKGFHNFWVTSYFVEYEVGVSAFERYKDPRSGHETIPGNSDGSVLARNTFAAPLVTQTVRVIPLRKHGAVACVTMELYGCNRTKDICSDHTCSTHPATPTTTATSAVRSPSSTKKANPTTTPSPTTPPVHKCQAPPLPPNMQVLRPRIMKQEFQESEIIFYVCRPGYRAEGSPIQTCGPQGWSRLRMKCTPKSCGDPGTPPKGRKSGFVYSFPSKVFYSCDPGYTLLGSRYRECQANQTWSGTLPSCGVTCPDPGKLPNGRRIGDDFGVDQVVTFRCDARYYRTGPRSLVCRGGAWDKSIPTCNACNWSSRYTRRTAHNWRRNRIELKFPLMRKVTELMVSLKRMSRNWKFVLRHRVSGQWTTYAEEGRNKYFRVKNGTASKMFTLAEPVITKQAVIQILSAQTVAVKQVTVRSCVAPSDSSDCVLVGSQVWLKGKRTRNDKRTPYYRKAVTGIKNNKVLVQTGRQYTSDVIPDVVPSSPKPGLRVIALDSGKYYSGTLRRRINKNVWEIRSHDVMWRSQATSIRAIEKPTYCF